jgi:hypothetical protein
MASVKFSDLTNEISTPTEGTGVFDKLLEKMETRIQEQYDSGRITGSDFAMVYMGLFQETLKSSITFLMNKDKAAMDAAIAEATVEKQWGYDVTTDVNGDLVLGASTGTGLVDYEATKAQNEIDLVIGQVAKVYADTALVGQKQTTEQAQTVDPTGGLQKSKYDLMAAQTLGFASDTKQKVLKQMFEGYAVVAGVSGVAQSPADSTGEDAIDALVFEILNDVGSTAMTNSAATPDIGAITPP